MNETKPYELKDFVSELPILPVIGFVLALANEMGYFFALGIELQTILTIPDIVKASALNVLPAIPIMLFGMWIGGGSKEQDAAIAGNSKIKQAFVNGPRFLMTLTLWMAASSYVLLGAAPEMSFIFLLIVLALAFGRFILAPNIVHLGYEGFWLIWIGGFSILIFLTMGMMGGYEIRSGKRNDFPTVTAPNELRMLEGDLYLFRRFSSGSLVGSQDQDRVWFIEGNGGLVFEYEIDPEPFPGLLCLTLDWCWANGWTYAKGQALPNL